MVSLDVNSLKIEKTGSSTTVPDNDIAKLMYYLDCVCAVIQLDTIGKYTDYKNYYYLNTIDENAVIEMALMANPKILIIGGVFVMNDDLIPYDKSNQFYQITDEKIGIHVNQNIIIGGKSTKVLKIMACNKSWLMRNYFDPIENLNHRIKSKYESEYSSNNNYNNYSQNNERRCCTKKNIIIIIVVLLLISIIGGSSSK